MIGIKLFEKLKAVGFPRMFAKRSTSSCSFGQICTTLLFSEALVCPHLSISFGTHPSHTQASWAWKSNDNFNIKMKTESMSSTNVTDGLSNSRSNTFFTRRFTSNRLSQWTLIYCNPSFLCFTFLYVSLLFRLTLTSWERKKNEEMNSLMCSDWIVGCF